MTIRTTTVTLTDSMMILVSIDVKKDACLAFRVWLVRKIWLCNSGYVGKIRRFGLQVMEIARRRKYQTKKFITYIRYGYSVRRILILRDSWCCRWSALMYRVVIREILTQAWTGCVERRKFEPSATSRTRSQRSLLAQLTEWQARNDGEKSNVVFWARGLRALTYWLEQPNFWPREKTSNCTVAALKTVTPRER